MNTKILLKQNIFVIPVGDIWDLHKCSLYIVYAPLGGHISLATEDSVEDLIKCAQGDNVDESINKALTVFQAKGNVPVHYLPKSPNELYQIDILCNYTCNFKS